MIPPDVSEEVLVAVLCPLHGATLDGHRVPRWNPFRRTKLVISWNDMLKMHLMDETLQEFISRSIQEISHVWSHLDMFWPSQLLDLRFHQSPTLNFQLLSLQDQVSKDRPRPRSAPLVPMPSPVTQRARPSSAAQAQTDSFWGGEAYNIDQHTTHYKNMVVSNQANGCSSLLWGQQSLSKFAASSLTLDRHILKYQTVSRKRSCWKQAFN